MKPMTISTMPSLRIRFASALRASISGISTPNCLRYTRGEVMGRSEGCYLRFKGCKFLLDDAAVLQIQPEEANAILFIADVIKIIGKFFQLSAGCDVASFKVTLLGQTTADHHAIRTALNRVQEIQRIDATRAGHLGKVDVFG